VLGVLAMRLMLALRFRQPLWSVPLHPFAEAFLIVLGIRSWWRWSHGSGVQWKDRLYSPRTAEGIAKQ
jgi:chlorobactene glucosyltransferase